MRALRTVLALGTVALLCPIATQAVDGVNEINQTSILAAGGFPYTIPAPGSYVLTSDLAPPPGTGALVAGADNIEIDLNGFTVASPGGGGPAGIDSAGLPGLTVRGGVVQGFGGPGIAAAAQSKVIEVKVTGNGGDGVIGFNCLVVMSNVNGNGGNGLSINECKAENNIIQGNGGAGIFGMSNVIVHNRIGANAAGGIMTFGGAKIQENILQMNTGFGISELFGPPPPPPIPTPPGPPMRNNIIGNVIDNNFGPGISLFMPALISQNSVTANAGDGITCGGSCLVNDNVVDRNNTSVTPGSGGVTVADGSVVHANAISFNEGFGLTLPLGAPNASYTNNTITGNGSPLGAGPDVISPPTPTGPFGNNCSGGPCP